MSVFKRRFSVALILRNNYLSFLLETNDHTLRSSTKQKRYSPRIALPTLQELSH